MADIEEFQGFGHHSVPGVWLGAVACSHGLARQAAWEKRPGMALTRVWFVPILLYIE
jgi:hypothetical protein